LSPGGSSTVHIYTQTIHRTTQNKQYIEQHNNLSSRSSLGDKTRGDPTAWGLSGGQCSLTVGN